MSDDLVLEHQRRHDVNCIERKPGLEQDYLRTYTAVHRYELDIGRGEARQRW